MHFLQLYTKSLAPLANTVFIIILRKFDIPLSDCWWSWLHMCPPTLPCIYLPFFAMLSHGMLHATQNNPFSFQLREKICNFTKNYQNKKCAKKNYLYSMTEFRCLQLLSPHASVHPIRDFEKTAKPLTPVTSSFKFHSK